MRRLIASAILGCTSLIALAGPVSAASSSTAKQHAIDWNQRDTAVYVVSTLNLLHTKKGQAATSLWNHKLGVSHYDVYDDLNDSSLYFILLKRDDGSTAVTFAYEMGWVKPRFVSTSAKLDTHKASDEILQAYKNDSRQLIGTFTSTLPH